MSGTDVVVVVVVLVAVVVDDGGVVVVAGVVVVGASVPPVVAGDVVDAPSDPLSLHAANAAAIVPARNPRRVSRTGSSTFDLQVTMPSPAHRLRARGSLSAYGRAESAA